ncbi:MAG TPA: response regulator transcription factor [Sphingomonadaceae bacterium]
MSRVLAVDDEPAIRRLLAAILTRGGHEAATAANAREALALLARGGIDAVLLDLGLPDRDGIELVGAIRAESQVPIIVVTARSDVSEKIAALDLGADDYVTKPFDADELLARLRSALRRAESNGEARPESVEFGPIAIDRARHEARLNGAPVALTPKEFAVLETLTEAGGRVLTHAAILERVWGKAHVADVDYLRVAIRALRLKLEADPSAPRLIRNEPAIGYRLADIA